MAQPRTRVGDAGYGLLRLLIYDGDERGANIKPKHKKIENNMIVIIAGIKIINNTASYLAQSNNLSPYNAMLRHDLTVL